MRKIISTIVMIVSVNSLISCTAVDELPGHMHDSSQKRVKKVPVMQTEPTGNELAV